MRIITIVVAVALLASVPAFAQAPTASVVTAAPIYIQPGADVPLRLAAVGTALNVLKEDGDWAQVEFNDPQWGRRIGWVQVKLIRISRPELQPMDLSVRDAPAAQPQSTAAVQPAQLPATNAGSSLHPQVRGGFWFNIGMGYGTLGCDGCLTRDAGLSGGLSLGTAIGDRVLFGVGTTGFAKEVEGELLSVGTLDARIRFYPVKTSGFFMNVGAGLGSLSYAGESEFGFGMMLGLGWDIRVGRNVSLTPFWNGFAMANSNVDANVGQIGIGVTIH